MIALGAVKGPLDTSFSLPGLGVTISLRSLLKMICLAADMDKRICQLIDAKPDEVCTRLVGYGDKWLHDRIEDALDSLVNQVLEGVDCQKKNWRELAFDSLSFSFSDAGIAVTIDYDAIVQNVVCEIARRSISYSLEQPINYAVRQLKEACAKLAASKPTATPTATSSSSATWSVMDKIDALYARVETATAAAKTVKPVAAGEKLAPPKTAPKETASSPWVWWAAGLTIATGGVYYLAFAKKRKR